MIGLLLLIGLEMPAAIILVLAAGNRTQGRPLAGLLLLGTVGPPFIFIGLSVLAFLLIPFQDRFAVAEGLAAMSAMSLLVTPLNLLASVATWGNRHDRWREQRARASNRTDDP